MKTDEYGGSAAGNQRVGQKEHLRVLLLPTQIMRRCYSNHPIWVPNSRVQDLKYRYLLIR